MFKTVFEKNDRDAVPANKTEIQWILSGREMKLLFRMRSEKKLETKIIRAENKSNGWLLVHIEISFE